MRPASIPALRERVSIWSLEEEAHGRLSAATVVIARNRSALHGPFKQRQVLSLHPLEGRPIATINHYGAATTCHLADHNLLIEVADAITDPHFVKLDFPWKLRTHNPPMLAGKRSPLSFSPIASHSCVNHSALKCPVAR